MPVCSPVALLLFPCGERAARSVGWAQHVAPGQGWGSLREELLDPLYFFVQDPPRRRTRAIVWNAYLMRSTWTLRSIP